MKEEAKVEIENYRSLRDKISQLSNQLSEIHHQHMACKKGCADCCMNFQVLPVEYYSILEELKKNPPLHQNNFETDHKECNFLHNSICQIYQARPIICRTHGLPLLYMNQSGDNWELSTCPLNFLEFDDFDQDNTYPQDTFNSKLFLINQEFIKHFEEKDFSDFDLIPLNQLIN